MDVKDMIKPEDEIDKLMRENGISREAAYGLQKEREEKEFVKKQWDNAIKQETTLKELPNDRIIKELPHMLHKDEYFEDKKFRAPWLANDIVIKYFIGKKIGGFLVTKDDKKIWRYNGGYWQNDGEDVVRDIMQQVLIENCNRGYKDEVINWIKDNAKLHIDRELFDNNTYLIPLENGVLDIRTNEFKQYSPDLYLTSTLPIKYDLTAECPNFISFLDDVLYKEDIPVVQEMFGYCFYRSYFLARLFFLVGTGRNGKSKLLHILQTMIGKQNIADIQLQELASDRFAKVDLYQKWANICGDLSPDELKRTGLIKMLTGQDYIRAQHKHERAFRFLNFAKLIFAMNAIPECNDATKAWSERIIVFEFPNQFLEGEEGTDVNIIEKLLPEISGIFNWSMIGLKRLIDDKKFSKHRNLEDVREFLATTRNPIFQFVNQFIQSDPNGEETKEFIYTKFLEFAKLNNFPTMAANHFSMKFKEYGPLKMEEGQSRVLDRKKTWKGIKFTGEKQKEVFVNDVNHPF